ncbi:MAG: glycosyltransferase family 4 protein [Bacteroidetes bacterium]|nr:glycosyltransferase family 4 protein [Bacteroidota bacterium]MBK9543790.1 glycosyltransferase family 4 protein [Bacteroidota bacterium]
MKKVIVVTNIPNPYRIPLFNEMWRLCNDRKIEFKVIFGAQNYARRKFVLDMNDCLFPYEILDSQKINFGNLEKIVFTYKGLLNALAKEKPDCIIINGFSVGTLRLWWRSWFTKTTYIIWSGTVKSRGGKFSFLRVLQRKMLRRRASAFVAYGQRAKEYLQELGAASEKIFIARNTVDTRFFSEQTDRERLKLSPDVLRMHFTYVGFIIRKKNLQQLLKAVKILSLQRTDFVLDLIGDGQDKVYFEDYVKANQLEKVVHFAGFVQKSNLPTWLAKSSCFVFPSNYDIWGLVVNEAMAAALPCISSVNSGVTVDLIEDGKNGFAVDFSDPKLVAEKMDWILDNREKAKEFGLNARKTIAEKASIHVSARGLLDAACSVIN